MSKVAIVYHSGYGHTKKQAEAVQVGAAAGAMVDLIAISAGGSITDAEWVTLDAADAIIFGSPTYMGSVSWQSMVHPKMEKQDRGRLSPTLPP